MQSRNSAPSTSLKLLARDGIVHVVFDRVLSGDEYLAILTASQEASSVDNLQQRLLVLGQTWGVVTDTKILSRQKAAKRSQAV